MARRIIVAALGGFLGLAAWYIVVSTMGLTSVAYNAMYADGSSLNDPFGLQRGKSDRFLVYFFGSMLFGMFAGGALVLFLCENSV